METKTINSSVKNISNICKTTCTFPSILKASALTNSSLNFLLDADLMCL